MIANYGYMDGSGEFFVRIDTGKCDGCADCVAACPAGVLQVAEDENDPLSEQPVAKVNEDHRRKLKYSCGPCKPVAGRPPLPCVAACKPGAIEHSW
ncbi:MAG: 4Fe-4S dicluster domain-containing protein [Elusimicrobia bacterium]|nr:4Fe-4S dicluster domain-containing protein [Elusimicrobiota bacterium]